MALPDSSYDVIACSSEQCTRTPGITRNAKARRWRASSLSRSVPFLTHIGHDAFRVRSPTPSTAPESRCLRPSHPVNPGAAHSRYTCSVRRTLPAGAAEVARARPTGDHLPVQPTSRPRRNAGAWQRSATKVLIPVPLDLCRMFDATSNSSFSSCASMPYDSHSAGAPAILATASLSDVDMQRFEGSPSFE